MAASALWTIFYLFLISDAQQCIRGRSGGGLPPFQDYRGFDDNRITRHHQAIIPSYKFDCNTQMCGNITKWGVDVRPDGGNHQPPIPDESHEFEGVPYTLDLQVWRPSPTVDDSTGTGCYSLVGNNRFTSIPLNGSMASSLLPSPSDYIMFQPGDVLGVYVEEARGDIDGVVILTSFSGTTTFTSESVWYAIPSVTTSQNGDCPYSVGSDGILNTLTQGAPVISISTVTFPCPPLPSMATTQPTPQPPNPTTDSEETPPTTNQQTQEPVNPLATNGNTNGDIQATDSEGATGTELRVPTTSETATDLPIQSSQTQSGPSTIGLIIGIVIIVVIISVLVVTVVVVIAILLMIKKRHVKFTTIAIPTAANQAYGFNTHKGVEESIYNFSGPEVDTDNTIEAKQNVAYVTNTDIVVEMNEAYATNIITEGNEVYATCIVAEGNQAYATNITTEGNQAYSTNITTEKDAAYEPVTTSGTADVYEVVNYCSI